MMCALYASRFACLLPACWSGCLRAFVFSLVAQANEHTIVASRCVHLCNNKQRAVCLSTDHTGTSVDVAPHVHVLLTIPVRSAAGWDVCMDGGWVVHNSWKLVTSWLVSTPTRWWTIATSGVCAIRRSGR